MNQPLIHQIENAYRNKRYKYFEGNYLDLNCGAIRAKAGTVNEFDDLFFVVYKLDKSNRQILTWPCTTDPGLYWLQNPMNVKGTAIVKPGQYIGLWQIGKHHEQDALVQVKPITVYRDRNKDNKIDIGNEDTGYFGINCHHGDDTGIIGKWSAGCQVFKFKKDHEEFMKLCHVSAAIWGDSFSFTLFDEDDIFINM